MHQPSATPPPAATTPEHAAPPAPIPPSKPTGYEFTPSQEQQIGTLATYMRIVGIISIVFALLQLVVAFMGRGSPLAAVLEAAVGIVVGTLTISIAGRFRQITETRGRDIAHLMDALGGMRLMYLIQLWVVGIAIAFLALLLLAVLMR